MTKGTVTKIFLGGAVAAVAGIVLAVVAAWIALVSGALVMDGPDVIGVEATPGAWSTVGLFIVAGLTIVGGFIAGLVSWIGALVNTAQIEEKTWFIVLLVLGLCSFGLVAMIAYVIAGPDGATSEPRRAPLTAAG